MLSHATHMLLSCDSVLLKLASCSHVQHRLAAVRELPYNAILGRFHVCPFSQIAQLPLQKNF